MFIATSEVQEDARASSCTVPVPDLYLLRFVVSLVSFSFHREDASNKHARSSSMSPSAMACKQSSSTIRLGLARHAVGSQPEIRLVRLCLVLGFSDACFERIHVTGGHRRKAVLHDALHALHLGLPTCAARLDPWEGPHARPSDLYPLSLRQNCHGRRSCRRKASPSSHQCASDT
eukprot:jgi/Pico_ML_1/51526/g209.t1